MRVEGRIGCAFGAFVYVDTRLEARTRRDRRTEVRGVDYTYHAWRGAGSDLRMLFRYDMAHGGLAAGKRYHEAAAALPRASRGRSPRRRAPPHLHLPDPATGEETGRTPVPLEALPNLDQLIRYAVALAARER